MMHYDHPLPDAKNVEWPSRLMEAAALIVTRFEAHARQDDVMVKYNLVGLKIVGTQLSVQSLGCDPEKDCGLTTMPVHLVQGGNNLFPLNFCQTE